MRPPTASQKVNTRAAQFVQCKNQQRTFLSDLLPSIEAMVSEAYQAVETLEQHAPTEDLAAQENWDPHPGDEVIWMKFIRRFGIIDILMIDRVKSWLGAVLEPLEGVRVFCNGQGNYLAQASTGRRKEIRLGQPFWHDAFTAPEMGSERKKAFDFLLPILTVQDPDAHFEGRAQIHSLRKVNWQDAYFRQSLRAYGSIGDQYAAVHFIRDISRMEMEAPQLNPVAHLIDPAGYDTIPGVYTVGLRRRQDFRNDVQEHFIWIGLNLSQRAHLFQPMERLHAYRISLPHLEDADREIIEHVIWLIRLDPKVDYVEQDTRPRIEIDSGPEVPNNDHPPMPARKRQDIRSWILPWYAKMLTIPRKLRVGGDSRGHAVSGSGEGVDIYVLDTGININHVVFGIRAVNFRGEARSPYTNDNSNANEDSYPHGTAVAGALRHTAPRSTIINVKCSDRMGGSTQNCARALQDIVSDHNDKKRNPPRNWRGSVVNISLTFMANSPTIRESLNLAVNSGISITAAAGNHNRDAWELPCRHQSVVCVAACNRIFGKWTGSNFGNFVQVIAPGEQLPLPDHASNHRYFFKSGTSVAAPLAAAVMTIFVQYEGLRNNLVDVQNVMARLGANTLDGVIEGFPSGEGIPPTPNKLVNTGISKLDKAPGLPYRLPQRLP